MAYKLYSSVRKWLGQTAILDSYRKLKLNRQVPKYTAKGRQRGVTGKRTVVFLCPSIDVPQGGVKVIYNQAAIINEMNVQLAASILHPYNSEFSCTWFASGAEIKRDKEFDPACDFVLIPECWAVPHARLIMNLGVRYGIYVQGGYILSRDSGVELDEAYNNAALKLAISDDTVECIQMAFPECADKVHRVHCSVDPGKFMPSSTKENVISYMPRRLKSHSQLVTFYLQKMIPTHWRIQSIDGLSEDGVAEILGRSKIFLSFSELEGFSLPPVEAALSGCHVIGYTGEGAKEYWDEELFTEIYSGDIKAFVKAVLNKVSEIDGSRNVTHLDAIGKLASRYSAKVELSDMHFVSKRILEILNEATQENWQSR
jgi:hypothetical protein